MKLDGPTRTRPLAQPQAPSARSSVSNGAARSAGGHAQVAVSGLSKMLASANEPETPDASRVARLKGEIDSGTFQVDAERIADAMLTEEAFGD